MTQAADLEPSELEDRVSHHFVQSGDVRLHYAALGEGAPVVMLHGFPDYWYTWRHQMPALAGAGYKVAAPDLRGYNLSGQPQGGERYTMPRLLEDVAAVTQDLGGGPVTLVGHDWGGAVAWQFALRRPELVERLVILNLPHPRALARELTHNLAQREASAYARRFQREGAHEEIELERLISWVRDDAARGRYREALGRSDFGAMLNYHKQNFAQEPYRESTRPVEKITVPILQIHGLLDGALLPATLNDTWLWMGKDYTLVTLPEAGHFVQHDAPGAVTRLLLNWLERGPIL